MITNEKQKLFSEILEELGTNLDISETQHDAAVASYQAVGNWLSDEGSLLAPYKPRIKPQGSFLLGTVIKPINQNDDIDIDLVCELTGKKDAWTQKDLKKIVGDRIKENKNYKNLLDEEGRRCWTLKYRENSLNKDKYHMDILPSIVAEDYKILLEKAFDNGFNTEYKQLAIRITDKEEDNYSYETNADEWLRSNPFGYADWFIQKAKVVSIMKGFSLNEAVSDAPKFQPNKFPLQRAIQILKRHRDIMFNGDDEKPISIIITTLAARAYNQAENVLEALEGIVANMHLFIEERQDKETGELYKFIGNPVNEEENFADKWRENQNKQKKFYKWLDQIKLDISNVLNQTGMHRIQESLSKSFGEVEVKNTLTNIGNKTRMLTEQGNSRFDTKLGIVASASNIIKPHTFYGPED
ncbi:MAG: hypothetical protein RL660_1121 [Bacteroidota bacterium]|jgi:hypothetical protein